MPSLFPQPGPRLPPYKTLLVKGNYHASAPIHLSLSHISESALPDSQTIIFSPSQTTLTLALQQYNDDWLSENSGLGRVSNLTSRVKLFFPPSPAHLCLLLSMLRVPNASHGESGTWLNAKSTLAIAPLLLILHEPSMYFLSEDQAQQHSSGWTLSSYLSLIMHALSSLTCLSKTTSAGLGGIAFAVFDSQLDQLKLPMVKRPVSNYRDIEEAWPGPRLEHVSLYAQNYFEWIVAADKDSTLGSMRKRSMVLERNHQTTGPVQVWEWCEACDPVQNANMRPTTQMIWQ
ncbi:hypothetical protein Hypma_009559 [Hypsizygus marmoreus]|uniref:Uncharacterized protein n=1 Tax=Hypsizygus marmoreus TaxID=39966 RepID=A0A369JMQ2_HYPMA|nr:hypothetical protein Hypma_009559 [Hypsizygus marmoreus]